MNILCVWTFGVLLFCKVSFASGMDISCVRNRVMKDTSQVCKILLNNKDSLEREIRNFYIGSCLDCSDKRIEDSNRLWDYTKEQKSQFDTYYKLLKQFEVCGDTLYVEYYKATTGFKESSLARLKIFKESIATNSNNGVVEDDEIIEGSYLDYLEALLTANVAEFMGVIKENKIFGINIKIKYRPSLYLLLQCIGEYLHKGMNREKESLFLQSINKFTIYNWEFGTLKHWLRYSNLTIKQKRYIYKLIQIAKENTNNPI